MSGTQRQIISILKQKSVLGIRSAYSVEKTVRKSTTNLHGHIIHFHMDMVTYGVLLGVTRNGMSNEYS
jgi:hypothetical protein